MVGWNELEPSAVSSRPQLGSSPATHSAQAEAPPLLAPFTVYLDPEHEVAKIAFDSVSVILKAGEWSDWVPVSFEIPLGSVPVMNVTGICRLYLKEISKVVPPQQHFAGRNG